MFDKIEKVERKKKEIQKTYSEVFDKQTLLSLIKMISDKTIDSVDFPISTGKEANVFRAKKDSKHLALKIYRTSTAVFKDLTKYIVGDPRFRNVKKKNIVYIWARKEYKNLKKLSELGVRVPAPVVCRDNILVMEYIGTESTPAPMLKNVEIKNPEKTFKTIIGYMKKAYKGGMVHGDMSEYNILMHKRPVIIDVGQAVVLEHPLSNELLERDVRNIIKYFRKFNINVSEADALKYIRGE
ncbi:MAG: serine protein kinase RIO [Euryarchaeota archaeon CG01_land_8_20_14_3_00_38_12]|nr:MAG: serine protein kinase RIO [Euryarchaeota archaeon CG01_land_8_20_14_3_00_38_12]